MPDPLPDYTLIPRAYRTGQLSGWIPPSEKEIASNLLFEQVAPYEIKDSHKDKNVFLYKALTKLLNRFPVHRQTIGDCVSHGWSSGIDVLKAVEIVIAGEREEFKAETCTEVTYGGSRVISGGGGGRGDGSNGSWAAKFVRTWGTITRSKYQAPNGETFDFTTYSGSRAREYGRSKSSFPTALETIIKEHPVKTTTLVTTFEAAADAITNGYPVPYCGSYGFSSRRDEQGFSRRSGSWSHCMLFLAVRTEGRPGLLCLNSWGENWNSGPKWPEDQPDGSFWVDADTCNGMLRQADSFAISGFEGYPSRSLDYLMI